MKVRGFLILLMLLALGCRKPPIQNLTLTWTASSEVPRPSAAVAAALAKVPFSITLQDKRPDVGVVGFDEKLNHVVRTVDNVGQHCADQIARMLEDAGARLKEPPMATLHAEIIDYQVMVGGAFNGTVRVKFSVKRGNTETWSQLVVGTNQRQGRRNNPANYNEVLSRSLASTIERLLESEAFAAALNGAPAPAAGAAPTR